MGRKPECGWTLLLSDPGEVSSWEPQRILRAFLGLVDSPGGASRLLREGDSGHSLGKKAGGAGLCIHYLDKCCCQSPPRALNQAWCPPSTLSGEQRRNSQALARVGEGSCLEVWREGGVHGSDSI